MSTTDASTSLIFACQQIAIYIGLFLLAVGLIGGVLVLVVFLSLRTFRESSCAFYLIIKSIVNICYLLIGLLPFIVSIGFGINWANMSVVYCKFRVFYVQLGSLVSITCTCLAAIDQFLATCSNPRWHQWNTIKVARNVVIAVVIVWSLYGIPDLIFFTHVQSPTTGRITCITANVEFLRFYNVVHTPVIQSGLPFVIMTVFGLLAYRNVRNIAYRTVPLVRRELDQQLTSMVLVQIVYDIIFTVQFIIFTIFNALIGNPTDVYTIALMNLVRNSMFLFYYMDYVVRIDSLSFS